MSYYVRSYCMGGMSWESSPLKERSEAHFMLDGLRRNNDKFRDGGKPYRKEEQSEGKLEHWVRGPYELCIEEGETK